MSAGAELLPSMILAGARPPGAWSSSSSSASQPVRMRAWRPWLASAARAPRLHGCGIAGGFGLATVHGSCSFVSETRPRAPPCCGPRPGGVADPPVIGFQFSTVLLIQHGPERLPATKLALQPLRIFLSSDMLSSAGVLQNMAAPVPPQS